MTPTPAIHALRSALGLTTGGLARLVGVNRATAHRWMSGRIDVPEPVLRLLVLVASLPDGVVRLRDLVDREAAGELARWTEGPGLPRRPDVASRDPDVSMTGEGDPLGRSMSGAELSAERLGEMDC